MVIKIIIKSNVLFVYHILKKKYKDVLIWRSYNYEIRGWMPLSSILQKNNMLFGLVKN